MKLNKPFWAAVRANGEVVWHYESYLVADTKKDLLLELAMIADTGVEAAKANIHGVSPKKVKLTLA